MTDFFVGEIKQFGGSFAPVNFAFCNGALMSINDNQTLYSLIGTTYGGDGVNTFALPDLRGRIPIGQGAGTGLSNRTVGQKVGVESVTLTQAQLPVHTHQLFASSKKGTLTSPSNALPAAPDLGNANTTATFYVDPGAQTPTLAPMAGVSLGGSGSSSPHNNMMPYLAVNYIIALYGIYPTRN